MKPIALFFAIAGMACAQQFEVASIRPSGPDSHHGSNGGPGQKDATRFTCGSCPMTALIQMGWDVKPFQISSPLPLDKDLYDINVAVPADASKEQFRVMLQNLLKDRFGFRFHMESREFAGYEVVIAKTGFKLKDGAEAGPDKEPGLQFPANVSRMGSRGSISGGYLLMHMVVQLEPMKTIVEYWAREGEPVVDHTGLSGKYSFTLDYSIDRGEPTNELAPAPSLFAAVQKELGLQLVSKKLPFDVVVVESFNRTPTEN